MHSEKGKGHDIDVVTVNWNSGALLRECVESVCIAAGGARLNVTIFVVDNASSDTSLSGIDGMSDSIVVIRNNENAGFGAACNQGARRGGAEFILFLNPDTRVTTHALTVPAQFLRMPEHADYAVCGVQLRDSDAAISRSCARNPSFGRLLNTSLGLPQLFPAYPLGIPMSDWDHECSRDVDHVIGAFYLIRRAVFEQIGGFDEAFFVYLEDLDLSLRVQRAGYRIRYLADAQAEHIGGGTSRQIKARRLFYSVRSRIVYVEKHFSGLRRAVLKLTIYCIEPVVRGLNAVFHSDREKLKQTYQAFRQLYKWALERE